MAAAARPASTVPTGCGRSEENGGMERRSRQRRQQQRAAAVQGTNDSSIVSKCSMASLGYFKDEFLQYFVAKRSRRAPLINWGYYIRAKAVDHCIRQFLLQTQTYNKRQILSLGAGFDSLYFRLKAGGYLDNTIVYEVDFPEVVRRKASMIKGTDELAELVAITKGVKCLNIGLLSLNGDDYKLLGIDLNDVILLDKELKERGVDPSCPTLLLAEVVLTYMENIRSSAVIHWAADYFSLAQFIIYEQFHPEDPFGQVMQQHFNHLNSKLHALREYPDREGQTLRFLNNGWSECHVMDMNEFHFNFISKSERRRIETIEPFDEFEEWHLKCSHYFILIASKGSLSRNSTLSTSTGFLIMEPPAMCGTVPALLCPGSMEISLRRYGHHSVLIRPDVVVSTGGFGEKNGQHGRLRDIHVLVRHEGKWRNECMKIGEPDNGWDGRLFHSMTWLSEYECCLVLGGRSSPISPSSQILCLKFQQLQDEKQHSVVVEKAEMHPKEERYSDRWRHSATEVFYRGQKYLFIYGGRSVTELALEDWGFLHSEKLCWEKIPVEGSIPEGRHSHSACSWKGGAVIAGGLGAEGLPLGTIFFLKPSPSGFCWQTIDTYPPVIPRYSHTAHVHEGKLLLVGGVWIHSRSVPGVTVIDLNAGQAHEYKIDVSLLQWPLMLHNHSSVLLQDERHLLILGGGGNCFSFGTHLNRQPVLLDLTSIL
ncbi:tRNA wybutosine-synthesizing protein 4 [Rhinatrema bivittatum]|uniref:tRNA wybutosine-synthesizing protein 4 n=1 Tax=Rhinatrema bivittatum TaxID=194408 RepID=UPI00112C5981|nr:tRNA wybutosine-synthesizing protein 4 [Rhinatrema bivittatum]